VTEGRSTGILRSKMLGCDRSENEGRSTGTNKQKCWAATNSGMHNRKQKELKKCQKKIMATPRKAVSSCTGSRGSP